MQNVVLMAIGLFGMVRLIAGGHAHVVLTVVLVVVLGFIMLWLAVKAWVSVR